MRWIVSALFVACAAQPLAQESVTLSVRVTDWSWATLPGIVVEIAEVENCLAAGRTSGSKQSSTTNRNGTTEFRVSESKLYRVATSTEGGFEAQTQCVDTGNGSDPRHVQLRVRPDPGSRVTLAIPAVPEKRRNGPLPLGEFAGAYNAEDGRFYIVTPGRGFNGLELTLPDGAEIALPIRKGSTFSGSQGTVSFDLEQNVVIGMTFTPAVVRATKSRK
jgi:hypothetical protein